MPEIDEGTTPLKRELDRRGIRYSWLAAQLGVKKWTFSRIEAGIQAAPDDWYERAAAILGVPVEHVLPEREPVAKEAVAA